MNIVPKIRELEERYLLGRSLQITTGSPELQKHWKSFITDLVRHFGEKPSEFYAVHEYDTGFSGIGVYTTWATIPYVKNLSGLKDMNKVKIEKGVYAIFTHHGPTSTFYKTLNYIHNDWLPKSGYSINQRKHFEYMGKEYLGPENPLSKELIYIPVKKM
ncbi:GyrI-like domain-containing protein [Aquimarina sp. W85]|uniref:GyrI-like domain-containing protein n=1 Tax=Aquimarina rhodophyticola TaxID=3342246 RepID=UPI0036719BEB